MAVDLNDERLRNVENEKNNAIKETTNQYNQMINDSDKYYQAQIDAAKQYEKTQTQLQNDQTQLTIDKINQQKDKAEKDYQREQRGAYSDYQKATNQYGVNAEMQAMQGLNRTGYSESTRTNAYNTYQNRYATARESYNNAVLNYDNGIKEAQLANSSALAQIAYNTLQQQLELSLQGFQYKNNLIQTRMNAVNEQVDRYNNQYQQVLSQINTENSLAEQIRQYNETMAWNKQQAAQEQANWERQYALSLASSRSSGSSGRSSGSSSSNKSSTTSNKKLSNNELSEYAKAISEAFTYQLNRYGESDSIKEKWRRQVYNLANNGKLTDSEASILFDKFNL
jgi:hypothetical protein